MDTVHAWVVPSGHRSRNAARQLLAEAAARMLDTDPAQVLVSRDGSGQPTVQAVAGQAWVSLSYGPAVLAVAASLVGPVGIDIEGAGRPEAARLAERWFDAGEAAWLQSLPDTEQPTAFLLLWTAKEALGKALGTGLRNEGLKRRVPLPPLPTAASGNCPAKCGSPIPHRAGRWCWRSPPACPWPGPRCMRRAIMSRPPAGRPGRGPACRSSYAGTDRTPGTPAAACTAPAGRPAGPRRPRPGRRRPTAGRR